MKTGSYRLKVFGKYIGPSLYISRWKETSDRPWRYALSFIYRWDDLSYKLQLQWPGKITCLQPKLKNKRRESKIAYRINKTNGGAYQSKEAWQLDSAAKEKRENQHRYMYGPNKKY